MENIRLNVFLAGIMVGVFALVTLGFREADKIAANQEKIAHVHADSAFLTLKSARAYDKTTKKDKGCINTTVKVYDKGDSVFINYSGIEIGYAKVAVNPDNRGQVYVKDSRERPYLLTLVVVSEKQGEPNPRKWLIIETPTTLDIYSELEECEELKLNLN